ncbi:NADH-ubiquinone oxidoreductase-F iron-sulfur binding region domain-containing protein [uncultured Victivallis sp.]|uniref:NADH-ubiquinone oxidoreductase-F iron-sulfur binding region domain-containing protein n=1 Tax=uncultured Victivallis sp. TaxID=354118 RepID=UPI0025EE5795|nr:NADH-ubiquinone oxidoreductase-F iron-sulfur binding region domain-containing protein [uncultured Victivallis sp.]
MKIESPVQLAETAGQLNSRPRPPMKLLVSLGTCGIAAGTQPVLKAIKDEITERRLENAIEVSEVGCMGLCYAEPVIMLLDRESGKRLIYGDVTPQQIPAILAAGTDAPATGTRTIERNWYYPESETPADGEFQARIVLRNTGRINPENIEEYIAEGGYTALAKVLTEMKPQDVIDLITASGLRGRGGGGFPTGRKWQFAANQPAGEKFIICNADEGDPGAFMDRAVLEGDPHTVLEAMAIGGYAIGASTGVIYIRAEYPLAVKRLEIAIRQAEERGLLGKNLFGSGFDFKIEIKFGAGAFVCGEETALIHSIEGKRGEPTVKPPFPAVEGLWKRPSVVNNVETYANICAIVRKGAEWFRSIGTQGSPGTKVFALAGKVAKVGLVEVPMGSTLREIIFGIGGGIKHGREFKAVQTGGPSGGCITKQHLDLGIDYESLKGIGSMMGSGGMIVMDEDDCMVNIAKFFLEFTLDESCGKCTPCRIGNRRLYEMLEDITNGLGTVETIEKLKTLSATIKDTALCGLGQTSPNPVLSTLSNFEEEYLAHVKESRCPAGVCVKLVHYTITDKCVGCGLCVRHCPANCISGERKMRHEIDQSRCLKCGACYQVCKFHAVEKH